MSPTSPFIPYPIITFDTFTMERPAGISKYNVANRLSKRSLLIAINSIAGLSIFFFGYDQ
jgi:hypothetical protein